MRRRRAKAHVSHDRWLVSYADFITLLFAFFVVLYAASKADTKKQVQFALAIDSAFRSLGLFAGDKAAQNRLNAMAQAQETPANIEIENELLIPPQVRQDFQKIQKNLEGLLSAQIAQHTVSIHIGHDGLVISLREAGFYDSGSAVPHSNTVPILNRIADVLRSTPYDLRIEGHTDNVPIHTDQFESNWELSAVRATRLARIFVVDHNFAPERLSAAGYAEFHPVASNASAEGRGQNRRVDVIVLPRSSMRPTLERNAASILAGPVSSPGVPPATQPPTALR
ncbi:MAG TPA: flagellar motor protein MotB [Acidisarcina sp.]|nr:flagellar motor protein MotB [Acidisarcina sp.]